MKIYTTTVKLSKRSRVVPIRIEWGEELGSIIRCYVDDYVFSAGSEHDYHIPGITLCGLDLVLFRRLWPCILACRGRDPIIDRVIGIVSGHPNQST